jgi:hypothetical protein
MYAMGVEIDLELAELSFQVHGIPEEHTIEVFAAEGSNQPFNEWVGHRGVWNRLDLIDLEHAQVCEPPVKAKQRIVIGTQVFR